ncbi:Auxin response factor 18 [Sesamum angolense]|uniref:Auxin response factor 18 n=1 Tax=Sesamum angolense TaxID=2727404 RepID=A0AAE2BNV2_9LAMI|nr:Auxin response factor 18 [Sesamum angolense]
MKETEKCLDSHLWHACAGSMVQMPPVNSKVFYFPQGHLEHACGNVDIGNYPSFPSYVPCKVSAVKFMADPETDEVFVKIRLVPIARNEVDFGNDGAIGLKGTENQDKPTSFAKTLTQSDANNGGGFSVPRYCAETIFPRLDYSADPPVQTILAKDVHGEIWKFRHIYRGTPRRHLLTTGWSNFVNHKKLVAGDSIVFLSHMCVNHSEENARSLCWNQTCKRGELVADREMIIGYVHKLAESRPSLRKGRLSITTLTTLLSSYDGWVLRLPLMHASLSLPYAFSVTEE